MHSEAAGVRRHLMDIRANTLLAQEFTKDKTFEQFLGDKLVFYGVTRYLEIISEASRRLPEELKARHPISPWADMAGAGIVFRHDYEDVQHKLVWGTVHNRLPALLAVIDAELLKETE